MLYKKNNKEDIQGGEVEVIFIDYHKNLGFYSSPRNENLDLLIRNKF